MFNPLHSQGSGRMHQGLYSVLILCVITAFNEYRETNDSHAFQGALLPHHLFIYVTNVTTMLCGENPSCM
jgi:hypothetical protein